MNTTLQKRIEEAAKKEREQCREDNNEIWRGNPTYNDIEASFIKGANFALSNQWISVGEALPEDDIQVLTQDEDGYIVVAYHDKDGWWWCDGFVDGVDIKGQPIYSSSRSMEVPAYWMYKPT